MSEPTTTRTEREALAQRETYELLREHRPATVEEMRTAARLLERTPWHERFAAWLLRRRP